MEDVQLANEEFKRLMNLTRCHNSWNILNSCVVELLNFTSENEWNWSFYRPPTNTATRNKPSAPIKTSSRYNSNVFIYCYRYAFTDESNSSDGGTTVISRTPLIYWTRKRTEKRRQKEKCNKRIFPLFDHLLVRQSSEAAIKSEYWETGKLIYIKVQLCSGSKKIRYLKKFRPNLYT